MTKTQWRELAQRRLKKILKDARATPGLRKLGPKADWQVELKLVDDKLMTELNSAYRGKAYPTDVLSFPTHEVFRAQGLLGELVIALPVMKRQAKELGHAPEKELQVLLVHGVLHLLGMDHEKGKKEAAQMNRWELRLLGPQGKKLGLIERSS